MRVQGLLKDVILLAGADLSTYVCPSRRPSLPHISLPRALRYVMYRHNVLSQSDTALRLLRDKKHSTSVTVVMK